jgi:phosphatidylglycerophosphate synthase
MTMPMPPLVDAEARARAPALRGAGAAVLLAGAAGLAGAAALARFLDDGALVFAAAVLLACGAGLVLWLAARHLAARTFGAANAVTLVRGTLVVLLAASLGAGATAALAWIVVGLGAAAAALDAVDGVLARRRGESSAFGARFDMEVDALLILVLAALAWQHGKAGVWILAAGLLRYLFVAASYALPWLGAALPPSRRRQAVCVVQIVSLLAALAPVVVPPWSTALALSGLAALVWSFGIDVVWLARHARARKAAGGEVALTRARHWLALGAALVGLNLALTFHNLWPTLWVVPRAELSIELGVLLLALAVWTSFVRRLGGMARAALTLLVLALVLGRYAEVTTPALYGRPVNLYWDAQHLPKIAAMLAEVAPWWLVGLFAFAIAALLTALTVGIAWCLGVVARALGSSAGRGAVGGVAALLVGVYVLGHWLGWSVRYRYSIPVAATYLQQARFIFAASAADPNRDLPLVPLPSSDLRRLAGDDVLLMFLESYGAVTYDAPAIARAVAPARDELAHAAAETGRQVVSAYASSPTFGGGSWLAHSSFMSGVEVHDTGDYMLLLTRQRETWPKLFRANGYHTIAVMPGMKNAWPEGAFYGFDAIHDELKLDYRGPDFGWWRIPDQFSLARAVELGTGGDSRAPVLTFFPTINTHVPFLPVPPYQSDWQQLLTSKPYPAEDVDASLAQIPDWEALDGPYADSFVYTFTYLAGFLRDRPAADGTLLLIGDHQPAASVAGVGARWDVPVHVVTRREDVAAALLAAGFVEGVALAPQQRAIATLPELSALLLETFGGPP